MGKSPAWCKLCTKLPRRRGVWLKRDWYSPTCDPSTGLAKRRTVSSKPPLGEGGEAGSLSQFGSQNTNRKGSYCLELYSWPCLAAEHSRHTNLGPVFTLGSHSRGGGQFLTVMETVSEGIQHDRLLIPLGTLPSNAHKSPARSCFSHLAGGSVACQA